MERDKEKGQLAWQQVKMISIKARFPLIYLSFPPRPNHPTALSTKLLRPEDASPLTPISFVAPFLKFLWDSPRKIGIKRQPPNFFLISQFLAILPRVVVVATTEKCSG